MRTRRTRSLLPEPRAFNLKVDFLGRIKDWGAKKIWPKKFLGKNLTKRGKVNIKEKWGKNFTIT